MGAGGDGPGSGEGSVMSQVNVPVHTYHSELAKGRRASPPRARGPHGHAPWARLGGSGQTFNPQLNT
eukprot:3902236-Prymnesium_polylepis.1